MVPVPRWQPVARQRLLGLLDEGAKGPLTLLAAPAGYGKTLLLTSWATGAGPPGPVAWVRIGLGDQHPPRFWSQVLAALRGSGAVAPDGLLAGLEPLAEIGDGFLRALVGGLLELDRPVVLILDDLHEAAGPEVTGQLRFLLRHAPSQLRLVVASRADPPLALHRLRVAGQLTEVREADLAFSLEETAVLLTGHGVELSGTELETLWRRTEGWAAGLRLAALSLREHPQPGRFVADLAGDDRAIAGYLVEEVLAAQPPELRAFLLRTCVADRLCGDLADALTGGTDGARVLARLEREHVFTSAAGPTRAWYRYHPLFAELLRAELHYGHAAELPGLHRRAASWHADAGQPVPAVRHALAAGDVDQAARLLTTDWAQLLAEGQAAMLGELVSRLPGERVRASPELAVVAALSRLALGELEEADAWLGVAAAAEPPFAGPATGSGAAMRLARLYRARLAGEVAEAGPAARELLASDGALTMERSGADDDQRTLAHALLGSTQLWSGQLEEAAANLERARADADRTGRQVIWVAAVANLALLEAVRGRLDQAGELARLASERARGVAWSASPQLACAQLATAVCAYHRDDLPAAWAALDLATRAALPGDRPLRLAAAVLGGWMAAASGRDQASAALRHLDVATPPSAAGRPGCWPPRPGRPGPGCWPRPATTRRHWPPSAPATGRGRRWRRSCWAGSSSPRATPWRPCAHWPRCWPASRAGPRSRRRWRSRPTWWRPWPTGSWPTTPPPSARCGGPSTWPRPRATAAPSSRVEHRCASCWPTTCTGTTPTTRWSARCWSGSGRPSPPARRRWWCRSASASRWCCGTSPAGCRPVRSPTSSTSPSTPSRPTSRASTASSTPTVAGTPSSVPASSSCSDQTAGRSRSSWRPSPRRSKAANSSVKP